MNSDLILFLDLETTGLSPAEDHIVEVGVVYVDGDLQVIDQESWCVDPWPNLPSPFDWPLTKFIRDMHVGSGLLDDATNLRTSIGTVDEFVAGRLTDLDARPGTVTLAGSGVDRFDRRFIERDMPRTRHFLHYAGLDLGAVRRTLARSGAGGAKVADALHAVSKANPAPHRALPDALSALDQMRELVRLVGGRP